MPNIEIHGCDNAEEVSELITKRLQHKHYREEYVITICPTKVFDHHGRPAPFIRLVTSPKFKFFNDILEELQKLRLDIEILRLEKFIPTKPAKLTPDS